MPPEAAGGAPDGFAPHFRNSPLTDPWQPLYSRQQDGVVIIGLRIREGHCNGRHFLHGGLICALADNAMGLSVIETMRPRDIARAGQAFTVSLSLDFLASGKIGQWLEFVPRVLKVGGSIAFVDCTVLADSTPIARANATFQVRLADKPA